jgi:hypothetical protein
MKTLLRKELHEWLAECALAGLLGGAALAALGRTVLDYGPPARDLDAGSKLWALFCMAAATAMGFRQLRRERTRHTEAYLHHRATGAAGAFTAKVAAGLLCLALILAIELGMHAAWFAMFSDAAPLARWERLFDHLALASILVSSYGLGLWTSAIPRSEGARLLLLLVGALSLYLLAAQVSLRWDGGPEPPVLRFVGVQVAIGALLIVQARRLQCAGAEPERPLPTRLALGLLPAALLLFGLPLAVMPTGLQDDLREEVRDGLPHVVLDRDEGTLLLAVQTGAGFVPADEHGQPLAGAGSLAGYSGWGYEPGHRYLTVYDPARTPLGWSGNEPPPLRRLFAGKPFEFDGPFLHVRALGRGQRAAWYDRAARRVLALVSGPEDRAIGSRRLDRPDGRGFSPDTLPVFSTGDDGGAALVDRADATAWRLADGERGPELLPAPLPDGERLRDVERVHGDWRVGVGLLEPYGYSDALVARGERGHWTWSGHAWEPFAPEPGDVLESRLPGAIDMRLLAADGDALLPHLQVRDAADGTLLLAHDYDARSAGQRLALAGVLGLTVLRPPLASLVALGRSAGDFDRTLPRPLDRFVLDAALAGGNRWWLVLLGFGASLLMARAAARHVGGPGADPLRRSVWVAAVALLGWPALLACTLVEPPPMPARTREPAAGERTRPLIASET